MQRVAAAATAELFELQPVRRGLFVLGRHVIPLLALGALQNYVISWHKYSSVRVTRLRVITPEGVTLATIQQRLKPFRHRLFVRLRGLRSEVPSPSRSERSR